MIRQSKRIAPSALLAVVGAVGAQASAAGVDAVVLRSLVEAARVDLDRMTVVVSESRAHQGIPAAPIVWSIAWTPEGFRTVAARSAAAALDGGTGVVIRAFDGDAAVTFEPDAAKAYVSASPLTQGMEIVLSDYLHLIGVAPMRQAAGQPATQNDPLALLLNPTATVLPDATIVDGIDCIVVEALMSPDSPESPLVSACFAPSLGYATMRLSVHRWDGSPWYEWSLTEWIDRGEALMALPLAGTFVLWDDAGETVTYTEIAVARSTDTDAPMLALGAPVDLTVALPTGTVVTDLDSGATWTVASATDRDGAGGLGAGEPIYVSSLGTIGGELLTLRNGVVLVACLVLGGIVLAARSRRIAPV